MENIRIICDVCSIIALVALLIYGILIVKYIFTPNFLRLRQMLLVVVLISVGVQIFFDIYTKSINRFYLNMTEFIACLTVFIIATATKA